VQVRILLLQLAFISRNGCLLGVIGADVVCNPVPVNVGDVGVAFRVILDAFDASLAIAPNPMVLAGLFLVHDLQIGPTAIKSVVIEEDDLVSWWCRQDLPVQVAEAVLSIDLAMPNGVALLGVTLRPVAPFEVVQKGEVFVIDEGKLILGKGNTLHWRNLHVLGNIAI
jgi:hypothetical protein